MASRMNYTTVEQFAEIVAANTDLQIYAVRRNVTGGNPNPQSFAVALPRSSLLTVGNKCIDYALAALFDQWRFAYVKARFQDLPDGSEINDGQFENDQLAQAYLEFCEPKAAQKLSAERIGQWFDTCTELHDALHKVLAKHNLSEQQSENQFRKFLHGLKKLAKRGAVSKKLAATQHKMLTKVAGINESDGITECLILNRLNEIINEAEVEEDDDLLDMTADE